MYKRTFHCGVKLALLNIVIQFIFEKNSLIYEAILNVPGNDLLSHTGLPYSTIGAESLNFRVRDGIGCFPFAIITGKYCGNWSQVIYKK